MNLDTDEHDLSLVVIRSDSFARQGNENEHSLMPSDRWTTNRTIEGS